MVAERKPRRAALAVHLRVFLIAGALGLAAYAVVRLLIALTQGWGWLEWLRG